MSPHETLFLESTNNLDIKYIANNSFVQFQIWDFPGDFDFKDELVYAGQIVSEEMIFSNCGTILFVIDAQVRCVGHCDVNWTQECKRTNDQ